MVDTAGTKLKRARKLRKLSLEDASRATKIRVSQLAELEADEYSNFANLAYAKSFLLGYARYLHVDMRAYLDGFADAGTFGLDDYQYLSETPVGIYRAPQRQSQVRRPKPKRGHFVLAAMALGLLAITGFFWFVLLSYQRLGDLDKLAARQEAREHGDSATAQAHPATEAVDRPAAATAPAQAPAVMEPVAEPVSAPADNATPAASVAPMDEVERAVAASLASADTVIPPASEPILPMAGDGGAVRQVLQPLAKHPVASLTSGHLVNAVHRDQSEPQKVVNSQPRE